MSHTWQQWNDRLSPLWAEVFAGHVYLTEDDQGQPHLFDGTLSLPLSASAWGLGDASSDRQALESALESLVQGHAPDYWRDSTDPLVQALGWLDRRIGRRTWEKWCEQHDQQPRNSLEQQLLALRMRSEQWVPLSGVKA